MFGRTFRRSSPGVTTLLCLAAALVTSGAVTAQGPFACAGEAYIVQDSAAAGIDGQLTQIDQAVSPFTFVDVGSPQVEYNNIGFNRADGFLYGIELTAGGNAGVVRVGDDGTVTNLGVPTGSCSEAGGFPTAEPSINRFDAGDVSSDGTRFYVSAGGSGRMWILDLTVVPPAVVACPTIVGDTGRVNDWAFNQADGNLYGGDRDGGEVARLDVAGYAGGATMTRTDFEESGLGFSGTEAFGGAWFDALGNLFLYRNDGAIFELVDVTGTTPTMAVVAMQTGPGSSRNDAAACAQNAVGVAKSMSTDNPTDVPATITIDYVFENFAPSASLLDLSAIEDLVAVFGTHGVDWTFTSSSSLPGSLVNPDFDGHAVTELVNQGPTQSLTPGATGSVQVVIELLTGAGDTDMDDSFCNQIVLTGDLGGVRFGDISTDGSDPDPDSDGVPVERDPACILQAPVELQSFAVE